MAKEFANGKSYNENDPKLKEAFHEEIKQHAAEIQKNKKELKAIIRDFLRRR